MGRTPGNPLWQGLRTKIGSALRMLRERLICTNLSTLHTQEFPQHAFNVTLYKLRELLKVRI